MCLLYNFKGRMLASSNSLKNKCSISGYKDESFCTLLYLTHLGYIHYNNMVIHLYLQIKKMFLRWINLLLRYRNLFLFNKNFKFSKNFIWLSFDTMCSEIVKYTRKNVSGQHVLKWKALKSVRNLNE